MLARSSQRSSRHIMWLRCSVLLFAFLLYRPQRSQWSSSHLPGLSMEDGHICVSANFASGRESNWDLLCTITFFPHIPVNTWPHMYNQYCKNQSSLLTVTTEIKLWQFLQWYKWVQNPFSHICLVHIPLRLYVHIWRLHILKHNLAVNHVLGNLQLISLLCKGDVTEQRLAYQYIVMHGLKLWLIPWNLIWMHCNVLCSQLGCCEKTRELETVEKSRRFSHSSQSM